MEFIPLLVLLILVSGLPLPDFSTVSITGQAGTTVVSGSLVQSAASSATGSKVAGTTSTSTSTSATSAPTTAANVTDALNIARGEVVQGLQEASSTLPQLMNATLTTNNTAVSALVDQATSYLALAVGGVETTSNNLNNGLPPNTGSNPQGQVVSALVAMNSTVFSFSSTVTKPDSTLLSLITSVQKSVLLAIQGAQSVVAAEGLSFGGLAASGSSTTPPDASQGTTSAASAQGASSTGTSPASKSKASKSTGTKSKAGSKTTAVKSTASKTLTAQNTTSPFAQDSSSGFNPLAPNAQGGSQGPPPFNPLAPKHGQSQSQNGIQSPSANGVQQGIN